MKFRGSILLVTTLNTALVAMAAHGSYVVEAEGASIGTDAIAAGAGFDFVTHDFGIESGDAIQIMLSNLNRAANLHGNLLSRPFDTVGDPPSDDAVRDGLSPAVSTDATDSSEDYSYYDEGITDAGQPANRPGARDVNGGNDGLPVLPGEPLPASVQNLPAIDTNAIFWILKPAEFTSFSQMTAARFGF